MTHAIDKHTALILVDVQPDFMPGGALACHQGHDIVSGIDQLLRARLFRHVAASQDWHPPGHISFASSHPGKQEFESIVLYGQPQTLWPDHCVQGTPGAELYPTIDWSSLDVVIRKGSDPTVDSYSAFRENHDATGRRPSTGLDGWLRSRDVNSVMICGLARDVCVMWTAQDALALGLRTSVLWDISRPVTPERDGATRASLLSLGVQIIDSDTLYI